MFYKNKQTFTIVIMVTLTIALFVFYQTRPTDKNTINSDTKEQKELTTSDKKTVENSHSKNTISKDHVKVDKSESVAVQKKILNRVKKIYTKSLGEDVEIDLTPIDYRQVEIKHKKYAAIEMIVKITRHNGVRTSFHAYIDSEDGDILLTWNQVRKDGLFYKKQKHRVFTPTGIVK